MAKKTKKIGEVSVVYYESDDDPRIYIHGFVVKSIAHIHGVHNPQKPTYIAFHMIEDFIFENPSYFKDEAAAVKNIMDFDSRPILHWQKAEWGWVAGRDEFATCLHPTAQDAIDDMMARIEEDYDCNAESSADDTLRLQWLSEIEADRAFMGDMIDLMPSIFSHLERGIEIAESDELAHESYDNDVEQWRDLLRRAEPREANLRAELSWMLRCNLASPLGMDNKINKIAMTADKAMPHRWPRYKRSDEVLKNLEAFDAICDVMLGEEQT